MSWILSGREHGRSDVWLLSLEAKALPLVKEVVHGHRQRTYRPSQGAATSRKPVSASEGRGDEQPAAMRAIAGLEELEFVAALRLRFRSMISTIVSLFSTGVAMPNTIPERQEKGYLSVLLPSASPRVSIRRRRYSRSCRQSVSLVVALRFAMSQRSRRNRGRSSKILASRDCSSPLRRP